MRILPFVAIAWCACNQPAPPAAKAPAERAQDHAVAVEALRAGRFDDAAREATAVLSRAPRDPEAAAVRAIAAYERAGDDLVHELEAVLAEGESFKAFDHARGRAAWKTFVERLDAVDQDLAVVAGDPSFSLELCMACWEHDWNRNGHVDERDRRLFEIETDDKGQELPEGDPRRRPTFRFDVGDADWARAMIAFQRAGAELVLAYRWSDLDHLFGGGDRMVIKLDDAARVQRARELIVAGVGFADRCREEYLAETDDDREWVPNPKQKSHPVPFPVDDALYATWAGTTADVRRLLTSEEGISMKELGGALDKELGQLAPDAYIDLGRMLREPKDIVIEKEHGRESPEMYDRVLRGVLGNGYQKSMKRSPLVARLLRMKQELDHGEDTFEHKLHYLFWLN